MLSEAIVQKSAQTETVNYLSIANTISAELIKARDLVSFSKILTSRHTLKLSSGSILCVLVGKRCLRVLKHLSINYPEDEASTLLKLVTKPGFYRDTDDVNFESRFEVSGYHTIAYGLSCLSENKASFLSFSKPKTEIPSNLALLKILAPYIHTALNDIHYLENFNPKDQIRLSGREIEILQWVSKGKTNYEIGIILGVSSFTVKNHIANIFSKLRVVNRAQAIDKANSLGYLS